MFQHGTTDVTAEHLWFVQKGKAMQTNVSDCVFVCTNGCGDDVLH